MSYRSVITSRCGFIGSNIVRQLPDAETDTPLGNLAVLICSGNFGREPSRSAWADALAGTIPWPVAHPEWWRAVRERDRQRDLKPAEAMTAAPLAVAGPRS
jgi:nucleoside-diphosphate-sugar epimerase